MSVPVASRNVPACSSSSNSSNRTIKACQRSVIPGPHFLSNIGNMIQSSYGILFLWYHISSHIIASSPNHKLPKSISSSFGTCQRCLNFGWISRPNPRSNFFNEVCPRCSTHLGPTTHPLQVNMSLIIQVSYSKNIKTSEVPANSSDPLQIQQSQRGLHLGDLQAMIYLTMWIYLMLPSASALLNFTAHTFHYWVWKRLHKFHWKTLEAQRLAPRCVGSVPAETQHHSKASWE